MHDPAHLPLPVTARMLLLSARASALPPTQTLKPGYHTTTLQRAARMIAGGIVANS